MNTVISQKDGPAVFVWNNNIEEASRLLRMRLNDTKDFKGTRKPRKSIALRQKRQIKRMRMAQDGNLPVS